VTSAEALAHRAAERVPIHYGHDDAGDQELRGELKTGGEPSLAVKRLRHLVASAS
jgi:hypothetical protein